MQKCIKKAERLNVNRLEGGEKALEELCSEVENLTIKEPVVVYGQDGGFFKIEHPHNTSGDWMSVKIPEGKEERAIYPFAQFAFKVSGSSVVSNDKERKLLKAYSEGLNLKGSFEPVAVLVTENGDFIVNEGDFIIEENGSQLVKTPEEFDSEFELDGLEVEELDDSFVAVEKEYLSNLENDLKEAKAEGDKLTDKVKTLEAAAKGAPKGK